MVISSFSGCGIDLQNIGEKLNNSFGDGETSAVAPPPDLPPLPQSNDDIDSSTEALSPLQPEEALLDMAREEAVRTGIADKDQLNDVAWQQAVMTRGQLANWLAKWLTGSKPLPAIPASDLSPYADMDSTHEYLVAMQLAQAGNWMTIYGENTSQANNAVLYAKPNLNITRKDLWQVMAATQRWLNNQKPVKNHQPAIDDVLAGGLPKAAYGLDHWAELSVEHQQEWLNQPATQQETLLTMAFWLHDNGQSPSNQTNSN